ncbi:oxidoreductase [Flavihumibacter petaseus]|uniref:Putative oxidoreductase n=1 Tax=Flavihumibacter petaseus NBRC 106054 TaxID=1220578 RepID=A0A0E9N3W4_9BACT|nr:oxidoreductase [Flavihumibacter petaseus]GAO44055.1 putative oxidoreductase [Flavihumibacter petaseus NBRC 106054]
MRKTVLITGASSGIGKATAIALAKAGHKVYGAGRSTARMQGLAAEGITPLAMDVADEASISAAVNRIMESDGAIDILINNAGYGEFGPIEQIPMDKARYQMEVNLIGPARLVQLVLPAMRAKGWGKIVNVSSIGGKLATAFGGWYHASKFALEGWSDALRQEVRPFGIDVIVIEPGAVKTEWGSIAVDNMLLHAEGTAYETAAAKRHNGLKTSDAAGADPVVIADLIMEALTAERPKARYVGGAFAAELLESRKNMTDEAFDAMITEMLS